MLVDYVTNKDLRSALNQRNNLHQSLRTESGQCGLLAFQEVPIGNTEIAALFFVIDKLGRLFGDLASCRISGVQ